MASLQKALSCQPTTGIRPEFISIDDGCFKYGVSRSMIYALIRGGKLKSSKIGRRRLLHDPSTREYFLERAEVAP
jgi:excisionase family DNA binding protein